jgi:Zn-dependent protease with chaperone function
MSERGRRALVGGLAVVAVGPQLFLLLCPHRVECLRAMGHVGVWLAGGAKAGAVMAAVSLLAWAARLVWLLRVDAGLVRSLARSRRLPSELEAALRTTGLRRASCVVSELPIAFCAGGLRPEVIISDGLVRHLRPTELQAVLIHELEHARRREPLLRAASRAAADVLFYAPVVRWWSRRLAARSELRADRAAMETVGRGPVAGALIALGSRAEPNGATAFAGIAELRVAQILGAQLPSQPPGISVLGVTWLGVYLAFVVTCCLVEVALTVAR